MLTSRATRVGATVLYASSLIVGLLWWLIAWRTNALSYIASIARSALLFGLVSLQILGWIVGFLLLSRSQDKSPPSYDLALLIVTAGVLFGNVVWLLTPVLGAPIILLASLLGLVSLFVWRSRESAT
jgi:hypothetical protein